MNIRDYRAMFYMTQADLAESVRVSQQTVARWEKGTSAINREHVRDMCVLFGCDAGELLGITVGEDDSPRDVEELVPYACNLDYEVLWGAISLNTKGGRFEYPVGWEAVQKQSAVLEKYHYVDNNRVSNWFHLWLRHNCSYRYNFCC